MTRERKYALAVLGIFAAYGLIVLTILVVARGPAQ